MFILRKPSWALPERQATPETLFLSRRQWLAGAVAAGAVMALPQRAKADLAITPEDLAANYNNFVEFGSTKQIQRAAQKLITDPWSIKLDGLFEQPQTLGFDDLIKRLPQEERVYRFRCVEGWSMVVPWRGFPLKALIDLARPLAGAKYLRLETFVNASMAPGQRQIWYPWPYIEGLAMGEAAHDLAFIATGAYGKPLAKQMGAPLRLVVPWKYGFKSIKSIVRITATDQRPTTFWMATGPGEYGFWANVNPDKPHPRWSQATERVLGSERRVPTQLYNGYGEYVAGLYRDLAAEKLFM